MVYTTLDEPWHGLVPTYRAAAYWARQALGSGNQRPCLVIGSPLGEVAVLQEDGWRVTYLDCRESPAMLGVTSALGDACHQPFEDASFEAISSTCVLCHVGTGRYGDALDVDAPQRMLAECFRVLKPGGTLVMMAGPVSAYPNIAEKHRVTSITQMQEWIEHAGLLWIGFALTKGDTNDWALDASTEGYLCVACVRP